MLTRPISRLIKRFFESARCVVYAPARHGASGPWRFVRISRASGIAHRTASIIGSMSFDADEADIEPLQRVAKEVAEQPGLTGYEGGCNRQSQKTDAIGSRRRRMQKAVAEGGRKTAVAKRRSDNRGGSAPMGGTDFASIPETIAMLNSYSRRQSSKRSRSSE
ncbi:MAG: hypothetical protein FD171_1709 [Actinobacteria bacterium]|nr:MAG: hypothetical protein FD171_1709 [Actinomycetota bacterium]